MTRIVTLGDSITLGMGDPDPAGPAGCWRGWARHLAAGLPDPELHNLAVLGAQVKHVERDQLPAALELRPDVASVVVGINDTLRAGFDPVRTGQAAARIVAALQAGGATVLTMRLPDPARMFGLPAGLARPLSRRMLAVNTQLDTVAARYGTLHWDAARDPETYDRRNWSVDRLHPNERGHRLIACRLWDSLAAAGYPVACRPDPEPTSPGPTRRDDFWWMATKGTKWFLRRSVDLIPYLLFMAAREALAGPREWMSTADMSTGAATVPATGNDAEWLPGIDETPEPVAELGESAELSELSAHGPRPRDARPGGINCSDAPPRVHCPGSAHYALMAMNPGAAHRSLVPPLLRDRVFRRYWGASTVSVFGDQVSSVAVPLTAVLVLHAGAAQMGYLTAVQWLPSLLFGLHAGAWVDGRGKRKTMIAADLGRAVALATVPVCYALHALTLVQMYLVTFAAGALSVLFTVSDGTLFVSIVSPERYVDGQSLIYGSRSLSLVGGPSAGGLLVEALTAPFAVVIDALSYLGSAVQLATIRPAEPSSSGDSHGVTEGMRFIAASPVVRAALTGVAVVNFFYCMFTALFMLFAVRDLGVRPGVLGLVIGAAALGGMLGTVLCKRLTSRLGVGLVYVAGCLVFTGPLALVPLAAGVHGAAVLAMLFGAQFVSGFGVMVLDISSAAIFAVVIPATVRSRVSGAFQAINYGTRPPGALLGGLLGSMLGLRVALWIAVTGAVAGALLLFPSPLPRFRMPGWVDANHRS